MAQKIVSVAQAFDGADRSLNACLHDALTAIESVHSCVLLPRVIFRHIDYPDEAEYRPSIPPQIVVDRGSRHKLPTVVHAIGHLLDQFAFGSAEYGVFESRKLRDSRYTGPLRDWYTAVQATQTVRTLTYALDDPGKLRATIRRVDIVPDRADLVYLLDIGELWARSYLQYITIKSQHSVLISALQSTLSTQAFSLFEQWPDPEFDEVEVQIDALFERLGWRKR